MKIPPAVKPLIAGLRRLHKDRKKWQDRANKVEVKIEKLEVEYREYRYEVAAADKCVTKQRDAIIERLIESGIDSEAVLEYMEKL